MCSVLTLQMFSKVVHGNESIFPIGWYSALQLNNTNLNARLWAIEPHPSTWFEITSLPLSVGDDKVKISNFRFFIAGNEKLVFLVRRRNIAESTVLGEYLLKMPNVFEIGSLVVENESSKNGKKWENHQKSMKFCQEFHRKRPECVQMSKKMCAGFLMVPKVLRIWILDTRDLKQIGTAKIQQNLKFLIFSYF